MSISKNINIINNLVKASLIAVVLASCSTGEIPTPQKLSQDVQSLPSTTVFSVISLDSYEIPKDAQIFEKVGTYKTKDNVYDELGRKVLIPRGAIVSGTYTNDGTSCKVTWKSVYVNADEYDANRGSFSLGNQAPPSICDPVRGVKKNDRLIIRLNKIAM